MPRSTKKKNKNNIPERKLTFIVLLVSIVFALSVAAWAMLIRTPSTFRSRVVKINYGSAHDGCDSFELQNGDSVTYTCFWSPDKFKGRIIGDINEGDHDLSLHSSDSYIKKINKN